MDNQLRIVWFALTNSLILYLWNADMVVYVMSAHWMSGEVRRVKIIDRRYKRHGLFCGQGIQRQPFHVTVGKGGI